MGALRFPVGRPYEDTPFIFEALTRATRYRYLSWFGYCYRVARAGSITEVYDKRLVYLFENLLDLEAPIGRPRPRPCRSCMRRSTVAS